MAEPRKNEKTGKWEFVFDYYDNEGKRRQVRRRGFKSKRDANDTLIDLQKEVQNEVYVETNNMTIGKFIKHWLENERIMECDETTHYNNMSYYKNQIEPRLGSVKLQKVNPLVCQQFVNNMHQEGYAFNTIDRVCTLIKQAFDKAVIYKYIKENHMRKVSLPRRSKKEMKIWTVEQANHFLNITKNRRFYCVYAIALLTGMRQGEILGLRWQDISFEDRTITVRQTLTHYGKTIKNGTKTVAGQRIISLSDQLIEILKQQRQRYEKLKNELGKQFNEEKDIVIFNLKDGGTVFPANLTIRYANDIKRSGLPHIAFHSMRHTHATMLIQKNVNVKIISERLGHSKIGITLDTYSHVLPSMQREVADTIDEIIKL